MNPYRIMAENPLGKEPLERQNWEISIRTDLRDIRCAIKKWMELGSSGPLPSDLQALLPYHRVEYANTEFFFTRDCAVLNIAEFGTSLMTVQEQCRPLHGEQCRDKKKRLVKCSWLTYALCAGPL